MAEPRLIEPAGSKSRETEPLLTPKPPTYLNFRHGREHGREPQRISRCGGFVLAFFKLCFCSIGLWGHQAWNYIPRVLFVIVCIFQTIYRVFIDCGCTDFDCPHSIQNSSETADMTQVHKPDVSVRYTVFTTVSIAASLSYTIFICSFIVAKRMDSALMAPSETLTEDVNKTAVILLSFAFVFIIATLLGIGASFYSLPSSNELRNPTGFNVSEVAGSAAQLLVHWASINTCQVFAVSAVAIGTFAQDALRLIRDLQNGTLDDVIRIHEDLCTVVFNTVSAYSVWFVLHWLSYGAGVVTSVMYISEEALSNTSTKYHTEFVYLGLILVGALFQLLFPCVFAARITSNCAGIYETINCTTSADWNEGHPFKDRRNVTMFVSYAERRRCGFKVGRITFNSTLAWFSFFFGLTGLLYHFF